jgi:hypothetical protein
VSKKAKRPNICVCLRIVVSNTYCVFVLFCFSSSCVPMLPVSLDCPFLIAPSVFSNVYKQDRQQHLFSLTMSEVTWTLVLIIITLMRDCQFQWYPDSVEIPSIWRMVSSSILSSWTKSIFGILAMFWRIQRPGYVTREATRILSLW